MPETPASRADTLKRRFAYDDWPVRGRDRNAYFVWNATLSGDELPGMTMARVKRIDTSALIESHTRAAAAPAPAAESPRVHVQWLWRDEKRAGVLVRVDLFECVSAADARDKALWLLGEFESPHIEPTDGVGEVAFASGGDGLILFVRGNLVYLLRNIDRRSVSVRQAALALDAAIVSTSRAHRLTGTAPRAEARESGGSEIIEATLQHIDAASPEGLASRTFVAPEGELALREEKVVYKGPRSGLERLVVYERRAPRPHAAHIDDQK